jgi:hypothetical protein
MESLSRLNSSQIAAQILRTSVRSLERMRATGTGPKFVKVGRLVNHPTDGGGKTLRGGVEPMMSGKLVRPGQPEMGNTLAAATVCGVGGSRTLYGQAGTQSQHGPVAGSTKPAGKDILNSFGPDSAIVSERK